MIVVDQSFDLSGTTLHSGGQASCGGGDPLQQRDIKGEGACHSIEELTEDRDYLFRVVTVGCTMGWI